MTHKPVGSVGKKLGEDAKAERIAEYEYYVANGDGDDAVAWLLAVRAFGIEKANEMFAETGTGSVEGRD